MAGGGEGALPPHGPAGLPPGVFRTKMKGAPFIFAKIPPPETAPRLPGAVGPGMGRGRMRPLAKPAPFRHVRRDCPGRAPSAPFLPVIPRAR